LALNNIIWALSARKDFYHGPQHGPRHIGFKSVLAD